MNSDEETVCPECHGVIHGGESLFALNHVWHSVCFRCSVCKTELSNCYYAKDTTLYCRDDYLEKFGDRCHRCEKIITGPVMVAGDHKYDPECFSCKNCGKFIVDNEDYIIVERHELLCGDCYNSRIQTCKRHRSSTFHTIRHMQIRKDHKRRISLGIAANNAADSCQVFKDVDEKAKRDSLCIKDVDNTELSTCPLAPGDKVLEVNGVLVTDENIKMVSDILCAENETVQVTIERESGSGPVTSEQKDSISSIKDCSCKETKIITPHQDGQKKSFMSRNRSLSSYTPSLSSIIPKISAFKKSYSIASENHNLQKQNSVDIKEGEVFRVRADSSGSPRLTRSSSLPRCGSASEEANIFKTSALIHRAQSFKVKNPQDNKVFRLADLDIGEVIGKGFFGQAMKVTHKETGELMVMKELINFDEDAQLTLMKEVALLKILNHPNVLKFLGVLWKGSTLNLITKFVAGGSLRTVIKNKNYSLPWTQRVQFAKDISSGMSYLHSMNVIHRDLNSRNCLVEHDGNEEDMTVIVADFGLARLVKDERPYSPSFFSPHSCSSPPGSPLSPRPPPPRKRYTVVGTPYWMAPEMLKGKEYDENVDVFSFGIVLCEIIGRVKADPDYLPRTKQYGLDEQKFASNFCGDCPQVFYQIAFLCCSLDPDERPSFMALEGWFDSLMANLELNIPLPLDLNQALSKYNSDTEKS